ncbi:MAG: hypothetical protein PVI06_10915 [Desulfobacterales bacterium]|jgi:hypothetical protein
MIAHKREFYGGVGLMAIFIVVLIFIFLPIYGGQNGLDYLDALYNSISKGSAYYIAKLSKEVKEFEGHSVNVNLNLISDEQAKQSRTLFERSGATAGISGSTIQVSGDLGKVLQNCLVDADNMYSNNGQQVSAKYGYDEKKVLFNWWTALEAMDKGLKKQKRFKEAKLVTAIKKKAVETTYNYYGIEPQRISERYGVVMFSLVFYVIYTLWYGFAIMFMFEGWGMKLEH